MNLGVVLLLLSTAVCNSTNYSYYGGTIQYTGSEDITVANSQRTGTVHFLYRENGRETCELQLFWKCAGGICDGSDNREESLVQTDKDESGQNLWCQSEGNVTGIFAEQNTSYSELYTLSNSGCCWGPNVDGKTNWTMQADVDLGLRNDLGTPNTPPVTATVSTLRVPQDCFLSLPLLAYDPDEDDVRCYFSVNATHPNITLDKVTCTLHATSLLAIGVHVFELTLQDHPTTTTVVSGYGKRYSRIPLNESSVDNVTPTPFSRVPLQFAVEIQPALSNCLPGHIRPQFFTPTPSHRDVQHAAVGDQFLLQVRAKSLQDKIFDFQISGPPNMTKTVKDEGFGVTRLVLAWTPQESDRNRHIPICFTAETRQSQSEMRCIVVVVGTAVTLTGNAKVSCTPNSITIVVSKASLPGVDLNWLGLADPTCSLTSNQTHIMGSMSLKEAGEFLVFKNEINSFDEANTVITRRNSINIGFSCLFPKTSSVHNQYQLNNPNYMFTESSFGTFAYTFDIYKDNNFSTNVDPSSYPVEVKFLDTLYMGIHAQSDLPRLQLFVESCKATPTDNPNEVLSYYLIKDGCVKDETLKVHSGDPTHFYFEVQALKFTGNFDQVYITCSVILCEAGNPNSRCAQSCVNPAARRRRRDIPVGETGQHYITQGPFRVVAEVVPREAQPSADEKINAAPPVPFLSSDIATKVFAGIFIMTLILLAVLVIYFVKKRRAEDQMALMASYY
ncbi:hypothetical protein DPEC_G00251170 [Dallia pectoralis]|uniref:Uncharacterized protein n=1 Tax=Dallia pectoralis TaxID=75939 RepID=A0ACC2FTI2_DALPE|nr:hypothetical protein DPEC_G00251170 [Dallia pectoralis]